MTEDSAEYAIPIERVRSVSTKTVKVNKESVPQITVAWQKQRADGEWDTFRYRSTQEAQVQFWTAWHALVPHALELLCLETLIQYSAPGVSGAAALKLAYDDEEHLIATLTIHRETSAGTAILTTPPVAESGDYVVTMEREYLTAILEVEKQALLYAHGVTA